MAAFRCRANYGGGVVVESVVLRLHLRGMGAVVDGANGRLLLSEGSEDVSIFLSFWMFS